MRNGAPGAEGARTRRGGLLKSRFAGAGREGKPFYIYRRRCAPGAFGAQRRARENGFGAGQVRRNIFEILPRAQHLRATPGEVMGDKLRWERGLGMARGDWAIRPGV